MTAESGARSPPVEVDARRGQRIVVGGVVVDRIAARTDSDLFELQLVKGLGFVLVTSLFLWRALDRWSARMQVAAQVERQAAERLPRAEEMRRTFLTGISHELRTALTAIVGYAETLEVRGGMLSDEQRHDVAERLGYGARRLDRLVLDLLEVERTTHGIGHLRAEPVDVNGIARRVVSQIDPGGRRVAVVGDAHHAEIDVAKVERMIEHLLGNAVRHTSPGVGIGLSLVAQYARLHGGAVTATNLAERGVRLSVSLPRRRPRD